MSQKEPSLRERTRRAVRSEIVGAALGLFLEQGFEATPIEQIAQAAGISRRSYFRYFASKDEVLEAALTGIGRDIAEALAGRPTAEPAWTALRRALDPMLERVSSGPSAEALARLMLERPALQRGKEAAWQSEIAQELTTRLAADGEPDADLRAGALAAAAITCLHTAQAQWLRPPEGRALPELVDTSMAAVHPLA